MMSKERELLMRWLAGEANQIPTHVPLLIETQNLLAQPEALAPEREFIRLWYENIELWKVHAKEPEHSEKELKENISQMAVEIYREGFEDGALYAELDLKREPLSEEAVGKLLMGGFSTHLMDLVRMVEQAHDIGVDDE